MQAARKLQRRAGRDAAGRFLIEGPLALAEALEAGVRVDEVFAAPGAADELDVRVTDVTDAVIRALSDTTSPQGVVAVARMPDWELDDLHDDVDLVLVLSQVRDPGNAGTLVRSAEAAGADAVVFASGSVDPFSPKTVRSAASSVFRVPIVRGVTAWEAAAHLRERGFAVVGADARVGMPLYEADLAGRVALVVGNEAWGLDEDIRRELDVTVSIPMPGRAESLNVGVAGSILLFETVRQRA